MTVRPLPLEWVDRIVPRPRSLILKRETYEGVIILPSNVRKGEKLASAVVVRVGEGVTEYSVGDRVMTAAGVNVHLCFGERQDEQKLYFCAPSEIMGRLVGDTQLDEFGEALTGRYPATGQVAAAFHDPAADEGWVKAPRKDPWA